MSATGTELVRYLRTLAAGRANDSFTDRQLLERFVTQREETSFAALVRRHGPMVLSVCRRVLGHEQDAEDAFQATFLVLARRAGAIRKQDSLSSWLHGVAYHVAERMRAEGARRSVHERKAPSRPSVDPADDVAWREIRCLLDSELARLPERYRGPLVLCYLQGKTQDEAARQLEWPLRTFCRRLKCARQVLVRRLKRRGVTLSAALSAPLLADAFAQAALPPLLAANTVRAGLAAATGQAAGALASAQVAALAEGGVGSLLAKKASISFVLMLSLMLGAGGLLAHRSAQDRTFAEAPAAPNSPPPKPIPQAARSASKDTAIEIKGRVLDPDGKPIAGAKVYVSTYTDNDKSDPKVRAETDADGRFRFVASRAEVDRNEMLAAVAPGLGLDWVSLQDASAGEPTLRLVKDDVPIQGRGLDLEGHPIVGATVRVVSVQKMPDEDLTSWLRELQAKPNRQKLTDIQRKYEPIMSRVWGILGSPKYVKADANGRFQLRGFGRNRIVDLRIEGPGIAYRNVTVITDPDVRNGLPPDMHGAKFDHVAEPGKLIRGTVREQGSGKPVAGARITCFASAQGCAISDKEGHYELPGCRKLDQYHLSVEGGSIILQYREVEDTSGLQPITADFEVEHALVVRVRVTEKGTGRPVACTVWYAPAADNPNPKNYTIRGPKNFFFFRVSADKDGIFNQVVVPGRGYIAIRADEDRFIPHIDGRNVRAGGFVLPFFLPSNFSHAVVPINPSADDPKSLVCDIVLEPGRDVSGVVVGPDGRPLPGVRAAGLGSLPPFYAHPELPGPRFTVRGLEPGKPRTVLFWHESKGLARAIVVRAEEKGPLTIRLEPRCEVAGRLVDVKDQPLRGSSVISQLKEPAFLDSLRPFIGEYSIPTVVPAPVLTDADGRFRIKGFVSGVNYVVFCENRGEIAVKKIAVKPGTPTVDLGEMKTKAIRKNEAKEQEQ